MGLFRIRSHDRTCRRASDIRFDQPAADHLYLRFTYETTLPEGMGAGEGVEVSEYVKAAYRESDLDTVRIIRLIAANGRPQ